MRYKDNPTTTAISAASIKGNAGPGGENTKGKNKVNSQNNQFKK